MKNIDFNLDLSQNAHVEDEYRLTINDSHLLEIYCPYRAHTLSTQNPLVLRIKNKPDWFVSAYGEGPYYVDEDGDIYSYKEDDNDQKVRRYINRESYSRLIYSPGTKVLLTDITVRELSEIVIELNKKRFQTTPHFEETIEQYHQILLDGHLCKKYDLRKVYITRKGLSYRLGDVVLIMKEDFSYKTTKDITGCTGIGIVIPSMITREYLDSPWYLSSVKVMFPNGYEPNVTMKTMVINSSQLIHTGINLNHQDPVAREEAYQTLIALDVNALLSKK